MPRQQGFTNCIDFFQQHHPELRRMASQRFRKERPGHTLQPTALVNEAFLRLKRSDPPPHHPKRFFAMASNAMRQILIEHARKKNAGKRFGQCERVPFEHADGVPVRQPDFLWIQMAMSRLALHDARLARVAELCLVAGFSTSEAAILLRLGKSTVRRDCLRARRQLRRFLQDART